MFDIKSRFLRVPVIWYNLVIKDDWKMPKGYEYASDTVKFLYQKTNKQYITVDNSSILLYTVYKEEDTYEDYNQQFINGTYI